MYLHVATNVAVPLLYVPENRGMKLTNRESLPAKAFSGLSQVQYNTVPQTVRQKAGKFFETDRSYMH